MKRNEPGLQTSATEDMTDQERHEGGHGGSYVQDLKAGTLVRQESTEPGTVTRFQGEAEEEPAQDSQQPLGGFSQD